MNVHGEIAAFDQIADAVAWLESLSYPCPAITGWYGFYHERGEQVSAIGTKYGQANVFAYSGGIKDVKIVAQTSEQTRLCGNYDILECADFEDEASWEEPVRPPAPSSEPAAGEPWEVEGWFYDSGTDSWLEAPMSFEWVWEEEERPPAPTSGPARGDPWEVEGWSYDLPSGTWLEAPMPGTWIRVEKERPPPPPVGPKRGEPWEVEGWSYDLPSGTWLEAPMPKLTTWFLVCRYWGFASRIGDNMFRVGGP